MTTAIRQKIERRGLALPAIRTAGGYFATKSAHDTAWGALLLTLFTPIGARPMNRRFGSGLHTLLFEPNGGELASQVEFVIRDAAERWTPFIVIRGVQIAVQQKTISIKVSFYLESDTRLETRLIEVPRDGQIRFLAVQGGQD